MPPKVAPPIISGVLVPAIQAVGGMRTRFAFGRGGDGGSSLLIPFATPGECPVVFLTVRPSTGGTLSLRSTARRFRVTPLPATLTQGQPRICPGGPERTRVQSKLDRAPEEQLRSLGRPLRDALFRTSGDFIRDQAPTTQTFDISITLCGAAPFPGLPIFGSHIGLTRSTLRGHHQPAPFRDGVF